MLSALLNRWAPICAERAVNAAVPLEWLEHGVAVRALVKPLTGIGGHRLNFRKTTLRAGQRGLQCDSFQFAAPTKVEG